jgi:hypothetical protein
MPALPGPEDTSPRSAAPPGKQQTEVALLGVVEQRLHVARQESGGDRVVVGDDVRRRDEPLPDRFDESLPRLVRLLEPEHLGPQRRCHVGVMDDLVDALLQQRRGVVHGEPATGDVPLVVRPAH